MSETDINRRETGATKLAEQVGQGSGQSAGAPDGTDAGKDGAIERAAPRADGERIEDGLDPQVEMTNHDAVREAKRLGGTDTYLVDADMEDIDQRQGEDGEDGRPSPLANADNPER
ncbi:MAG: hypothetical protein QE284_06670 [Rhizobium sp.]|nr:hypothetical protein [Rhizobium sp.]